MAFGFPNMDRSFDFDEFHSEIKELVRKKFWNSIEVFQSWKLGSDLKESTQSRIPNKYLRMIGIQ